MTKPWTKIVPIVITLLLLNNWEFITMKDLIKSEN